MKETIYQIKGYYSDNEMECDFIVPGNWYEVWRVSSLPGCTIFSIKQVTND